MIVSPVDWDDPDAVALRAAQRVEIEERYGTPDSEPGPAPTAHDITVFFVAHSDDGEPLGCGGLRQRDDSEAEIKRMFVAPEARGQGVARRLLEALEDAARDLGYTVVRLDTGPRQPHAQALYEATGYAVVPNFNDNPVATFFGEKRLDRRPGMA